METAEWAFREAVIQMPLRSKGQDRWSSREVFWTAVRFGAEQLSSDAWATCADRWTALWSVAVEECLAPIPGAAAVGASPSVAAAELGLAQMRAIVGGRGNHVHR